MEQYNRILIEDEKYDYLHIRYLSWHYVLGALVMISGVIVPLLYMLNKGKRSLRSARQD